MRRVLFIVTLSILLVTACAPAAATQAPATDVPATDEPAPTAEEPTPTHIPVDITPAQRAAITTLADNLGISADEITLVSTESVIWPDGCLGVVKMGVMCTQAEVPGFRIMLEANGKQYEFHTNETGSVIQSASGEVSSDDLAQVVVEQLAMNLGLDESDITVVSNEPVDFGDSCLGVSMPEIMCAQIVTPGRIIVLEADNVQYEYHTSGDASRIQPATMGFIWKREGGIAGFCDTLTVFRSGEVYTNQCNSSDARMGTFANLLSQDEQAQFNDWMDQFGALNLDASDPAGVADRMTVTLDLFGTGSKQPTDTQEQALFEFAQNMYQELMQ